MKKGYYGAKKFSWAAKDSKKQSVSSNIWSGGTEHKFNCQVGEDVFGRHGVGGWVACGIAIHTYGWTPKEMTWLKFVDWCFLPNCTKSNQSIALGKLPAHNDEVITLHHVPRNYFTFRIDHLVFKVHLAAAIAPHPVPVTTIVPSNIMQCNILYRYWKNQQS